MKPISGRRRKSLAAGDVANAQTLPSLEASTGATSRWEWWAWRGPFLPALASGLALWAAFPPLGLWPLAWIAPLGWLVLIRRARMSGWRAYVAIWLAGVLHWAAVMQGVRLAHPALYLGWVSMSVYLAIYPLLFVGLTRVAVHRLRISVVVSAPIVWTGLELLRGHALTGFSIAVLGHTQFRQTALIQIADLGGAYAVSFAIVFVAAALARWLPLVAEDHAAPRTARPWWPLVAAAALMAGILAYGTWRQRDLDAADGSAVKLKAALIQASFDAVFEYDPERERDAFARYLELSRKAVKEQPELDLIVWPESVYAGTLGELLTDGPLKQPADVAMSDEEFRDVVTSRQIAVDQKNRSVASDLNRIARRSGAAEDAAIWMIVGTDTRRLRSGNVERYNSALLIDPNGEVASRYYKMHLVMFGEYIPFGRAFPLLYQITPMTTGLTPGTQAVPFETPRAVIAPSICFESTVPHLIRRQVNDMRRRGRSPDVLVTVTNDGWFWGSSILDLHLACAAFRAVENRLPFLVAANTGLSACIDQNGRITQQGPRRAESVLHANVTSVPWTSWYLRLGDLPAGCCLLFCCAVSIVGAADALGRRKRRDSPE